MFQDIFQNNLPYLFISLAILIFALFVWNTVLNLRFRKFQQKNKALFSSQKIPNLESLLLEQSKTLQILDRDIQELYNISNQINRLAGQGIHKVGLVRFNPFKDVGGDQSFSIALLNGKNNGLVISSLFTRDGARVYAKSIVAGEAEKYPLTKEEEKAIKIALSDKFQIRTQDNPPTDK